MQLTSKLRNKSTTWSALLKVRVNDVVVVAGVYYQNITGINSAVTDTNNWFVLNSAGGGGSSAIVLNKVAGNIAGADPDFYIDLTGGGLPAFPASVMVYVDITGGGTFSSGFVGNYDPATKFLHGMNDPVAFPAQLVKIVAI